MSQLPIFAGAFRYEFRMQARRRVVWIVMLLIILFAFAISSRLLTQASILDKVTHLSRYPLPAVVAYWTSIVNNITPLGVGCLMADRLPRDQRSRVDELFTSMPAALSALLLGKYLGAFAAVLIPVLVFYVLGVGYILMQTQNALALPLALVTFVAIVLPGMLFVSAFSFACTSAIWLPLYLFLFICYWFWGNALPPGTGIPTLNGTILTPTGGYIAQGLFGAPIAEIHATPQSGVASLLVLVGLAIFVLAILYQGLTPPLFLAHLDVECTCLAYGI